MQRGSTPHDSESDALGRVNTIVSDLQTSPTYKLIALMHEAAAIRENKLQQNIPSGELFAIDPFDACIVHFKQIASDHKSELDNQLSTSIAFNGRKTSVIHTAYRLKKEKGKELPEMESFASLLEMRFPEEIKENKKIDKLIEERKKADRQDAYLCREGKRHTNAFDIFMSTGKTATQKYIELMHNAYDAFKDYPQEFQTEEKLYKAHGNHELDTSLHLTNTTHMLYNHTYDVVQPNEKTSLILDNKIYVCTPMDYARELSETIPALGEFFQRRLTQHQERLNFKKEHPEKFISQTKQSTQIAKMTPQQRFEAS